MNASISIIKEIKASYDFRKILLDFVNSTKKETTLLERFFENFEIEEKFIPKDREKVPYLLDVIYFLIASGYL